MKEVYEGIVSFLKNYQERTHVKGYVLGISGGKDSTVVAKLLVDSIGKENILGVLMISKLILRIVIQYVTFLILTILLLI